MQQRLREIKSKLGISKERGVMNADVLKPNLELDAPMGKGSSPIVPNGPDQHGSLLRLPPFLDSSSSRDDEPILLAENKDWYPTGPVTEADAPRLRKLFIEDLMRTQRLEQLSKADGKQIGFKLNRDALAEQGPKSNNKVAKKHEWIPPDGNPKSELDYKMDSFAAWNFVSNAEEFESCFEPRLIAWGAFGIVFQAGGDEARELGRQCAKSNCVWPPPRNCPTGLPAWWEPNYFEVIEYWLPEHQVSYNNFGINRLRPQDQSNLGQKMTRTALLQDKKQYEEKIKQSIKQRKIIENEPTLLDRSDPHIGQQHWGGISADFSEYGEVHGYRTRASYKWAEEEPADKYKGWRMDREPKCIINVFPPKKNVKDIINMWSEYKEAAWYWRLPEFTVNMNDTAGDPPIQESGSQEPRTVFLTKALYGDRLTKKIHEVATEHPAFWINSGPSAYRLAKWPKTFGDLKFLGIQPDNDEKKYKEQTLFPDLEKVPLTGQGSNVFKPVFSNAGIAAEKWFHFSGNRAYMAKVNTGDPKSEKHRMVEFTVNFDNRESEIDKMQRVFPLLDNGKPSQCFRSQRMPNNLETTEDEWVKQQFPSDLPDYTDKQQGDVNHIYWNKHVTCTCEYCGIQNGCWKPTREDVRISDPKERRSRPDGDWRYALFEEDICNWSMKNTPLIGAPSAFVNYNNLLACFAGYGSDGIRNEYKGLQDRYSELPSQ